MLGLRIVYSVLPGLLLAVSVASAAAERAGMIKTLSGDVKVERAGDTLMAGVGTVLYSADSIRSGPDGTAGITLQDNTLLTVGPDSHLDLEQFRFDPRTQEGAIEARLQRGSLSAISGAISKSSPDAVRFTTSTITLGVRGTRFILEASGDRP